MKIDCFISDGCTSENALRINIDDALLQENITAKVHYHRIDTAKAKTLGLLGSPSILLNGEDILPGEIPGMA